MVDVGTGVLEIVPKTDTLASTLTSQVSSIMSDVGTSASGQLGTVAKAAEAGFTALGVGAVAAIGKGISATTEWAGEVRSLQAVTGLAAEDASGLAAAGNELGISTSSLNTAFGALAKNIANGSTNLEKYGIATTDASGVQLPFNEILANISDKFQSLPTQMDKAAFAQNVFGRSGKALIPLLNQGSEGLREQTDRARELGLIMSQDDVDAAKALTLAQRELGEALRGASITIGKSFVPAATEIVHVITDMVALLQKVPGPVLQQIVSFTALAGILSVAGKALSFVKSGLAELPGAAENAVSANVDVADSATNAAEAVQTVSSVEQGTVAIKVEAATATTGLATAMQTQAVAASAAEGPTLGLAGAIETEAAAATAAQGATGAWAGQLAALNAAAIANTEKQILLTRAVGGTAGAFELLNAPIVADIAPLYGLYKGLVAADKEFRAIADLNIAGTFNALGEGLKIVGINLPKVADPQGEIKAGLDSIKAGLEDGTLTVDSAALALDALSAKYNITIGDSHEIAQALADEAGVTGDAASATDALTGATEELEQSQVQLLASLQPNIDKLGDMIGKGHDVFDIFKEMGTGVRQFKVDAATALAAGGDAFQTFATTTLANAKAALQSFHDSAVQALTFAPSLLSDLTGAVDQATSSLRGDTSNLTDRELSHLRDQAHVTASEILHTFNTATVQTRHFGKDLVEVAKIGGKAGKDLAQSLLESGNVLAAQVIADSPGKLQNQIVTAFGQSEKAADTFSTKLTHAIVGPLEDIKAILLAIAKKWGVDVDLTVQGKNELDSLQHQLAQVVGVHNATIVVSRINAGRFTPGDVPPPTASGGIVMTPQVRSLAEKGPEAVIPLDRLNQGPRQPTRIVGSLRMTDWKQGLVDLDGQLDWERLARSS